MLQYLWACTRSMYVVCVHIIYGIIILCVSVPGAYGAPYFITSY
jgi:hypothetical protein